MNDDDSRTEPADGPPVWYPTVETVDQLFKLAEPGARCRVQSEGAVYLYFDGQWRRVDPEPPARRR